MFTAEDWRKKGGSIIVREGRATEVVRRHLANIHSSPIKILDVGSGNGLFIDMLPLTYEITAADTDTYLSSDSAQRVKKFLKIDLSERWEVSDCVFDAVTAWNVLEHVENAGNFAREASRVLKHGGYLFVSMPNIFNLQNRLYFLRTGDMYRYKLSNSHVTILTKLVMKRLFTASKLFECVDIGFVRAKAPMEFLAKFPWINRLFPETELFSHTIYYVLKKL